MADLSKIRIGLGQVEVVEGRPNANEAACDRMVDRALDEGADALVVPASLADDGNVRIIGLNDSRIDVAGKVVMLDACGESYRIGLGENVPGCDFSVVSNVEPFAIKGPHAPNPAGCVVLKPVGSRDAGHKVFAYEGGSCVVAPSGRVVQALAANFQEDFSIIDFTGEQTPSASALYQASANPMDKILDCLVATMRRFDAQVLPYAPKWVIGLSGGLDSSITAALLVLAFGSERVVGYNMATRFNTNATISNATRLSQALGIACRQGSIEGSVVALGNALMQYGYPHDALGGLVLENAQARARGNLLSAFAAIEDGVVVNNGNRVECALGYATLYGDAIGALAPIADLTKVQLFDLAACINRRFGFEVVPTDLLPQVSDKGIEWRMRPSAELSSGQFDPMKWFYHDWLISRLSGDGRSQALPLYDAACDIMEAYTRTRLADTEAGRWVQYYGLDDPQAFLADLNWVIRQMQRSAYKRIQAPPAICIASRARINSKPDTQVQPEPTTRYNVLARKIQRMTAPY